MTKADLVIFVYGVFATLVLVGGLIYTVREFREIDEHPERFVRKKK
jgi:hypothetical protein